MEWSFVFFFNSILLGVGLAMDAFSVSLANGLNAPCMGKRKMCGIAGLFACFQALMPLAGWICVHTIVERFKAFEKFIPWIALILLCYIGGKMLHEGIQKHRGELCEEEECPKELSLGLLIVQGVATSIDALSVGFTIADYGWTMAVVCVLLIAVVTFFICMGGLMLGRKFGTRLSDKADLLGGTILVFIGVEIFITSFI